MSLPPRLRRPNPPNLFRQEFSTKLTAGRAGEARGRAADQRPAGRQGRAGQGRAGQGEGRAGQRPPTQVGLRFGLGVGFKVLGGKREEVNRHVIRNPSQTKRGQLTELSERLHLLIEELKTISYEDALGQKGPHP